MCFCVDDAFPKAMVAEHNILCWKVLKRNLCAPCTGYQYVIERIETSAIGAAEYKSIGQGLHSYAKRTRAARWKYESERTFVAIIPKGATFWFNGQELVSNQLAVFASLEDALVACGQTKVGPAVALPRVTSEVAA